jgi:hypothetical protein
LFTITPLKNPHLYITLLALSTAVTDRNKPAPLRGGSAPFAVGALRADPVHGLALLLRFGRACASGPALPVHRTPPVPGTLHLDRRGTLCQGSQGH